MKSIIVFFAVSFIFSCCNSQSDYWSYKDIKVPNKDYVELSIDYGRIDGLMSGGRMGERESRETFFLFGVDDEEMDKRMKQRYLIFNLHYDPTNPPNKAYSLLDSMQLSDKYKTFFQENCDGNYGNWSKDDLAEMRNLANNYFQIKERFNDHVKLHVETSSLETGISYNSFLTYDEYVKPKDTLRYDRIWRSKDFGIYPSDGIPDGKKIQHLLDSALKIGGTTVFMFEYGSYCYSDLPNGRTVIRYPDIGESRIVWDIERTDSSVDIGTCWGCCDDVKKKERILKPL